MLKVLFWVISTDGMFLNDAIKILERQHKGLEFVGVTGALSVTLKNSFGENLRRISPEDVASNGGGV